METPEGRRSPSGERPCRAETIALYIGAAGLALGHTLVAQVILLGCAICRLLARPGPDPDPGPRPQPQPRHPLPAKSTGALLALAGWMLFSAAFSRKPDNAFGSTLGVMLTGWLVLGATRRVMIRGGALGPLLVKVFLASSALGSTYVLAGLAALARRHITGERVGLPFVGCNAAGTILAVAALVAVGCAWRARSRQRLALSAVGVLTFLGLVATQSRGALIGFAGGLVVLVLHHGRRAVPVLLAATALVVALVLAYPPAQARYASILSLAANDDRLDIWRTALAIMRDHPLVGVGVNNFPDAYMTYPHEATPVREQPFAHNLFLELGATAGVPGLLLTLLVAGLGVANGIRTRRRQQQDGASAVALAVFVALLCHLQLDLTIYSMDMLPLFFVPYAVLAWFGEHEAAQEKPH